MYDYVGQFETLMNSFDNTNLTNLSYTPNLVRKTYYERSLSDYYTRLMDTRYEITNNTNGYYRDELAILTYELVTQKDNTDGDVVHTNFREILGEYDRLCNVNNQDTSRAYEVHISYNNLVSNNRVRMTVFISRVGVSVPIT